MVFVNSIRVVLVAAVATTCSCHKKTKEVVPDTQVEDAGASQAEEFELVGVPKIPVALEQKLNSYQDNTQAHIVSASVEGSGLLLRFGRRFSSLNAPSAAPTVFHTASGNVVMSARIRADPDLIVYLHSGAREQYQVVVHDSSTEESTTLKGISKATSFAADSAGRQVAVGNTLSPDQFEIKVFGGDAFQDSKVVFRSGLHTGPACFSPDNKTLLIARATPGVIDVAVLDLASGKLRWLTDAKATATSSTESWTGGCAFTADGSHVYMVSNRATEFTELFRIELSTNTWTSVTTDLPGDVEGFALAKNGTLAFSINDGGVSRLFLQHGVTQKRTEPPGSPGGGIIRGISFDGDHLVFSHETGIGPRHFYTYDLQNPRFVHWGHRWIDKIAAKRKIEPKWFAFETFDGRKIPAFSLKPPGDGPFPVLIDIHGGPRAQSRPAYRPLQQLLAGELGIAVIVPNVRGSAGSGKSYGSLDNGENRKDAVRDIGALLDWIEASKHLDARRVCVTGGSYGGFMTLASLVAHQDRLTCGISMAGVSNLVTLLESADGARLIALRREYGDERDPEQRKFLERVSPLSGIDRIAAPLFISHGYLDPRVPISESKTIADRLRRKGNEVWSMYAPTQGHSFQSSARTKRRALSVLFLQKHLFGDDVKGQQRK